MNGFPVVGYRQEPGVSPHSETETYVALRLRVENWRWAGVPVYVRTGKRLPARVTEVALQFHSVPFLAFKGELARQLRPNALVLRIQPNEGISLHFGAKVPGEAFRVQSVAMDFDYDQAFANAGETDGYPRLLHDAMCGDATLFIRTDEVEQAWRIVDPYLEAWSEPGGGLYFYQAGTWGPHVADLLLERSGDMWRIPERPPLTELERRWTTSPGPSPTWWRGPWPSGRAPASPWCSRAARSPGPATSGWPPWPRAPSTGRPSISTWATSGWSRPRTPTPTSGWSARPWWGRWERWGRSPPCPPRATPPRAPRSTTRSWPPSSPDPGSTWSTWGWVPTATRPPSSPAPPRSRPAPTGWWWPPSDPGGANPHPRLTLTLPAIARARRVVFTVSGAAKRQAVARLVAGDDIPAARVRAPEVRWLVDAEALGVPS